jgi:hypothetical protein
MIVQVRAPQNAQAIESSAKASIAKCRRRTRESLTAHVRLAVRRLACFRCCLVARHPSGLAFRALWTRECAFLERLEIILSLCAQLKLSADFSSTNTERILDPKVCSVPIVHFRSCLAVSRRSSRHWLRRDSLPSHNRDLALVCTALPTPQTYASSTSFNATTPV